MADIRQFDDVITLTHAVTEFIVAQSQASIKEQGRFSLAVAGGGTPRPVYELLASNVYKHQIEWEKVHIFFGDERTVPPDYPDSNYKMVKDALLDFVPIPANQIYRIKGEIDPHTAADDYTQALKSVFGLDNLPRLDVIMLGMGDDGHTASLFPHTAAIHETEKWVIAHRVENLDTWRITLTPPVINQARFVAFMVAGQGKAGRLNEVVNGVYQPDELPSQIVKPIDGELIWFVDSSAAQNL